MEKAERINLADYEYSGEGANGASYLHKYDPSVMLKLYNATAPMHIITDELTAARQVFDMGIPTPEPGVLVTDGERFGIRFKRILNKKSFSRAIGDNPGQVEHYARQFARLCKTLHTTPCDTKVFENVKVKYKRDLQENPFFTAEEKQKIATFIDSTPDAYTAIHGDLQFSNVITDGQQNYFIDLGDFAYGNPMFDLGMVLLTSRYDSDEFLKEVFHMSEPTAGKFWDYFVVEYFGPQADPEQKNIELRPYAGLKTIIIERNAGCPFPQFRALLDHILD